MIQLDGVKLDEIHLNEHDIQYIEKMRYKYLEVLGDKLNKEHFQYFEIKKGYHNRSFPKYYYNVNGQKKTIKEISDIYGVKYHTLYRRLNKGLDIKQAIGI